MHIEIQQLFFKIHENEGLLTDSGKEWGVGWGHFFFYFCSSYNTPTTSKST
jgi:hypothetical protein